MSKAIGLLLLSFFLSSCSAKLANYYQNTKPSEALTVAEAGGLDDLNDLREDQLNKIWKVNDSSNEQAAIRGSMALGTATGFYSPPPGFSSSASTNLLAAGAILSFLKVNEAKYNHTFVWMPKSEAATAEEARAKLEQYFIEAYEKALPNYTLTMVNEVIPDRKYKRPTRHMKIVGENCEPRCGVYGNIFAFPNRTPSLEKAPDFLGEYEAWTWKKFRFSNPALGVCCGGYGMTEGKFKDDQQRLLFLRELSRHLPPWIYSYIPPKYAAGLPMMFNNGRQLLFVRQPK